LRRLGYHLEKIKRGRLWQEGQWLLRQKKSQSLARVRLLDVSFAVEYVESLENFKCVDCALGSMPFEGWFLV